MKIDKRPALLHHGNMRYLILFVLFFLGYYALKKVLIPVLRTYKQFKRYRAPSASADKELVQDPHCQTYIPKETALRATIDGKVFYFCSQKCLEEFKRASGLQDG